MFARSLAASILIVGIAIVAVQAKSQPGKIYDGKWGNDVRHGPCVTGDGTPADSQENWILAFARPQKDLPDMPKGAKFHDDWQAFISNYTFIGKQVPNVLKELKGNVEYEHGPWKNINASLPYTRVCVPSPTGLKNGLKPTDYNLHFNPTGTATDTTATLFYKAFVRDGKLWMGLGIGQARH